MKRLIPAIVGVLALATLAVPTAFVTAFANSSNGQGNKYGQLCNHGTWQTVITPTGQAFASQDACVAYVSNGGVLYPKTPTLNAVVSGPEAGQGPLIGTPAMRFTVTGSGWIPGQTVSVTYVAAPPLGYTFANPTAYFSPPSQYPVMSDASGNIGSSSNVWFQDNCVDSGLVTTDVSVSITGTDGVGQSATWTGTLPCSKINNPL